MAIGLFTGANVAKKLQELNLISIESAKISVHNRSDGSLANLYTDKEATIPITNPFVANDTGNFYFYTDSGEYKLTADKSGCGGSIFIEVGLSDSGDSCKISDYLNTAHDNLDTAIIAASLECNTIDFEGLTLSTDNQIVIPSNAICRNWILNGADLSFNFGEVVFESPFNEIDMGGGAINLGLKLAQVAPNPSFMTDLDTSVLTVNDASEFSVGDIVNSSLDVNYLPNASDRLGYIENGDFNRITNITGNVITLSYNFLRAANGADTGLVPNAWVSNSRFDKNGLYFKAGKNLKICNGTLNRAMGYAYTVIDGEGDLRKSILHLQNLDITNTFLDIALCQLYGHIYDNVRITRQFDFAKQALVLDQPTSGFVVYKNGCNFARQNFDKEILVRPFDGSQENYIGHVYLDGTNVFDGNRPADLPWSWEGQVLQYYGLNVVIDDCLYFCAPAAGSQGNVYSGGFTSNGDSWTGYERTIFGNSFQDTNSFNLERQVVFKGSFTSCDPVYFDTAQSFTALETRRVLLVGGEYQSRGTPNFNREARTTAIGAKIIVLDEFVNDKLGQPRNTKINECEMTGGELAGRFQINGVNSKFENVLLPYRGLADAEFTPIFSTDYAINDESNNFIFGDTDDVENTGGALIDYDGDLPIGGWIGTNAEPNSPAPPTFNFTVQNYSGAYKNGGTGGFGRPYNVQLLLPRIDVNPSPTRARWTANLEQGDWFFNTSSKTKQRIKSVSKGACNENGSANVTSSVLFNGTVNEPRYCAIYSPTFKTWFYNIVLVTNGKDILFVNPTLIDFSIGDPCYLIEVEGEPSDLDASVTTSGIDTGLTTALIGKVIYTTSANNAVRIIIPNNTTDAIPIGATFLVVQEGTGELGIEAVPGVDLNGIDGGVTNILVQYGSAAITKRGFSEWVVTGSVAPVL